MKNEPAFDDNVHVMPTADVIEHTSLPSCECIPTVDEKTKYWQRKVYVHRLLREESN